MTLLQPPVFIASKHEPYRELVGSALRWKFECQDAQEKPLSPSAQKQYEPDDRPVQPVGPADATLEVSHAPGLQTLSAKALRRRLPR